MEQMSEAFDKHHHRKKECIQKLARRGILVWDEVKIIPGYHLWPSGYVSGYAKNSDGEFVPSTHILQFWWRSAYSDFAFPLAHFETAGASGDFITETYFEVSKCACRW